MLADVIGVLQPAGELIVELVETADVAEVAHQELVPDGTKEAFDLALGGTVPDRRVNQHRAEPGADDGELIGGIVGAVVHVDGLGDAALVERGLEAVDEVGGVVGVIEGAVRDDAGSVVNEADEEGLDGLLEFGVEIRTVQGVALPEVVGMGLGKCQPRLGAGFVGRFEQVETVDVPAECVRRDLGALEEALLNAGAVHLGNVILLAVEGGQDLLDGFQQTLGRDLAGGALVGAARRIGDAVLAVVIPPGLDGSPGELEMPAVFIGEGHRTDRLIADEVGLTFGIFECAKHPHSQIIAYAFHVAGEAAVLETRRRIGVSCCCEKNANRRKQLRCHLGHPGHGKAWESATEGAQNPLFRRR